jgi:hypothetical protein
MASYYRLKLTLAQVILSMVKQCKAILDKAGRDVGVQYYDDDDHLWLSPWLSSDKTETFLFRASLGHPLGIKLSEYGLKASPNGICIGSWESPFNYFRREYEITRCINEFNDTLEKFPPDNHNLEGREFQIRGLSLVFSNVASTSFKAQYIISVKVNCTRAIGEYLGKWSWLLTGSAKIDIEDKMVDSMTIDGIAVFDVLNNNTAGQIINLVQYTF